MFIRNARSDTPDVQVGIWSDILDRPWSVVQFNAILTRTTLAHSVEAWATHMDIFLIAIFFFNAVSFVFNFFLVASYKLI